MTENILHELTEDGIAVMTLNRAPVNAFNPQFLAQIDTCLAELREDNAVRAVVLASGLKVFSAGLDLKEVMDYSVPQQTAIVDGLTSAFTALYAFPKPLIVAAGGSAIAGGMFLVMISDFTIARQRAKFGLSEVRVGACFPSPLLEIARDALSTTAFRRILLSGNLVDADEALTLGIVDDVQPADQVMQRAMAVARDYASLPPLTYAAIKAQMRAPTLGLIDEILKSNADPTRSGWFSEETAPAMKAVLAAAKAK